MRTDLRMTSVEKWLTIVGIGEDGIAGLGDEAKRAISGARHVFGGARHLELARGIIKGQAEQWPVPFAIDPVLALRGQSVCVLASGDPFFYGAGIALTRRIPAAEIRCLPSPSAFSLAASRLGWPLQNVECVSLHGRSINLLRPLLHPHRHILALTSDGLAPGEIAALITSIGFGGSRIAVLEALGGPAERIRWATADSFDIENISPLNVLAIEVESNSEARIISLANGLPDALFDTDGQLTKSEVRAVTLSGLAPRRGELLWDVGAGSGSIAIEWMLADPSIRAIAIEANKERAARVTANANSCGVPGLKLIEGAAPEALANLETPDAIFIGGGGSDPGVIPACIKGLKPGGRLVANAVTLEMEALLLDHHARLGGELIRIAVSRAQPVGSMQGWRAAMPVTQWRWRKP
ncbi:precorrin-6y C5,15-methyltransferase (decarboxylating) subunit CbiE [Mesorhizobium denitrificans]|uniref:Precorrin-6y C5,15-methyltransferase (Decarboxylating) subunit CbiE n=2 Tax=Phyllobacteriaceae TaxID=69277 RepID=A0A371XFX7_9HYPH|nr:precorrin-6y C5,15-methyltransferase (decarboxylating) subunit CbiE [Mesorhizobium denitrificans]